MRTAVIGIADGPRMEGRLCPALFEISTKRRASLRSGEAAALTGGAIVRADD